MAGDIPSLIRPEIFTVPAYQWLAKHLKGGGLPPTKPQLMQAIVEGHPDPDAKAKHEQALMLLYERDLSGIDDATASFRRYIAFQIATGTYAKALTDFKRDRNVAFAIREMQEGVSSAERVMSGSQLRVTDYASSWGEREAKRIHRRDNPDLYPRLRLGIPKFDQQVPMETGTVTNFLAPMKRYKSLILATAAFCGLLQGFNVVLVVLENAIDMTMDRMDSMITRIGYDRIVTGLKTKQEKAYADELMHRLDTWMNRLKVIKGEPYQTGIAQVRPELKRLAVTEAFVPELFVFDYLNIAKPSTAKSADGKMLERHEQQTQIAFDMQSLAKDPINPCIIVTASQSNMAGLENDKNGRPIKIGAQHQGQSIGIGQAVDANIAVNLEVLQTEDTGWQPPQIIFSILFLRNGKVVMPDIPLISAIDEMCIDRSTRALWHECEDGLPEPIPPA